MRGDRGPVLVIDVQDRASTVTAVVAEAGVVDRAPVVPPPGAGARAWHDGLWAAVEAVRRRVGAEAVAACLCAESAAELAVADALGERLELPVVRAGRSVIAAVGEAVYGDEDRGRQLHVGVGVDVGALIVAGEGLGRPPVALWHRLVDPRGPPCGCGRRGCLAAYASEFALRRGEEIVGLSELRPRPWHPDPGLAAHLGWRATEHRCPLAGEVLDQAGRAIGRVVAAELDDSDAVLVLHGARRALEVALRPIRAAVGRAPRSLSVRFARAGADAFDLAGAAVALRGGW